MSVLNVVKNNIVNTISDEEISAMAISAFNDHLSDAEIAKQFGMTKPTYYKIKKTDRFQSAMKAYGEIAVREANHKIQANADQAVNSLLALLDNDIPQVRLKAAIEILRLAGLGQPLPELTVLHSAKDDKALLIQYLYSMTPNTGKGDS